MGEVRQNPDKQGRRIDVVVDSGAWRSVIPPWVVPEIPLQHVPLDESRPGRTAAGEELPTLGKQTLTCAFLRGQPKALEFLVMAVTRPLGSVSQMVERGCRVVFDDESSGGSYLEHKATGDKHRIFLRGGIYVLPAWVQMPEPGNPDGHVEGFPRPAVTL